MQDKSLFFSPINKLMGKLSLNGKFTLINLLVLIGYLFGFYVLYNSAANYCLWFFTALSFCLTFYALIGCLKSLKQTILFLPTKVKLMALGELELGSKQTDAFSVVLTALAGYRQNMYGVIEQINEVSSTLNSSAHEIASGNSELSERTQDQASCLVETSASLNNLTTTIKKNAESAKEAADLSNNATFVAQKGGEAVNQVITTMGDINESAQKIQEITGVIDGIAFQTNLLALNASVEAARAGEQGRGFAVVASEVRNLAQRSAEAAKQIKGLINDSMTKVASGDAQVKVTFATMQDIVSSIENVNTIIGKIAIASNEQSMSIEQINIVIAQLEGNTQKNAAQVEEVAASAELLKDQSSKLVEVIDKFEADKNSVPTLENKTDGKKATKLKPGLSTKNKPAPKQIPAIKSSAKPKPNPIKSGSSSVKPAPAAPKPEIKKEPIKSPKDRAAADDSDLWKEF